MRPSILSICILLTIQVTGIYATGSELQDIRTILASQAGQSSISVPTGQYLLDFSTSTLPINFSGLSNVVIDFNGSTIVCNKQTQAFRIDRCENLVIKNFYLEYDPPTCTQGTITAINGNVWDVELHQNYPTTDIKLNRTQVYDADTRELVRNFTTIWEGRQTLSWTGDRTLQLTGISNAAVKAGDFVVMSVLPTNYIPHTIQLTNCKNCQLSNITIYDSNCFSFFESDCERTHYYRCTVTRKLNDPKYPDDRLRAGFADGIHSKHAKVGPTIEECTIEHSGDDCIAINGSFYPVYKVNATTKSVYILTAQELETDIKPKVNDMLMIIKNDGTRRGKEQITKIVSSDPTSSERSACFSKLSKIRDQDSYRFGAKIVLSEWIDGIEAGDMVYSHDRIGSGFKVINNNVGHNRSRAILIKASDGVISGNTITHSAMSAIAIAPEFYWLEAGCSENLEIADNHISDCMYDASMLGSSQAAALTVVSEAPNGKLAACGTFANINIHHNDFADCPFPAVLLNSIDGGYYYDNTIENPPTFRRRHGANFGIPSTRPDYILNCNITKTAPASVAQAEIGDDTIKIINGRMVVSTSDMGPVIVTLSTITGLHVGTWAISPGEEIDLSSMNHGIYIASVSWHDGRNRSQKIIL